MNCINILTARLCALREIIAAGRDSVTVKECATITGLDPATVRSYVGAGRLPKIRDGRRVFIPLSAIEKLI